MTEWIVSNAWWFAPTLAAAGVGMFVGALLWPRQRVADTTTALQAAVHRRGRHLRTD